MVLFAWLMYDVSTASAASASILWYYAVLSIKNAKERECELEIMKFRHQLKKDGLDEAEINRILNFTA